MAVGACAAGHQRPDRPANGDARRVEGKNPGGGGKIFSNCRALRDTVPGHSGLFLYFSPTSSIFPCPAMGVTVVRSVWIAHGRNRIG